MVKICAGVISFLEKFCYKITHALFHRLEELVVGWLVMVNNHVSGMFLVKISMFNFFIHSCLTVRIVSYLSICAVLIHVCLFTICMC